MTTSTEPSSGPQPAASPKPWSGLQYQQVTGLSNRLIARWLRTQRKNMRRFFAERGLFDELEQMERILKSRQGMMAKNQMFQEVLDAYAKRASPRPSVEAAHREGQGSTDVVVRVSDGTTADAGGSRPYAVGSVPELAGDDSSGPVIEE